MKRFLFFTIAIVTMFLTTGCMKYSYNFEIDKDGNIIVAETQAINPEALKDLYSSNNDIEEELDEEQKSLKNRGYQVEKYKDDKYIGLKRSKKYNVKTLKKYKLPAGFSSKKQNPFEIKEGFFKNTMYIDLSYNIQKADSDIKKEQADLNLSKETNVYEPEIISKNKTVDEETGEVTEVIEYSNGSTATSKYNQKELDKLNESIFAIFETKPELKPIIDLTIKIPYKAVRHNATNVINDNEYQWNLILKKDTDINLVAEKINWNNILGMIFVLMALIAGLIFWCKYKETISW